MLKQGLSETEALKETIKMWDYIAEHNLHNKFQYFKGKPSEEIPFCWCYCCDFAHKVAKSLPMLLDKVNECQFCPIWKNSNGSHWGCESLESPYRKWADCSLTDNASPYAKEIADLARKRLTKLEEKE